MELDFPEETNENNESRLRLVQMNLTEHAAPKGASCQWFNHTAGRKSGGFRLWGWLKGRGMISFGRRSSEIAREGRSGNLIEDEIRTMPDASMELALFSPSKKP